MTTPYRHAAAMVAAKVDLLHETARDFARGQASAVYLEGAAIAFAEARKALQEHQKSERYERGGKK